MLLARVMYDSLMKTGHFSWVPELEWKPELVLDQLTVDMPARYQCNSTGQWRCPPGEAHAEQVGLTYRVRSSAEYHPLYIQNLKFLQDFWAHPVPIEAEQEAQVLALVDTYPGIRLTEILDAYSTLSLDVVWALLATRRLFTDFTATSLMFHDQVTLYRQETAASHASAPPMIVSQPQSPSPPLIWDGRMWLVESVGDVITLRPEVGERLSLPSARFQHLMQAGAIQIMTEATPSPTTPEIREAFLRASPKAQKVANQRLEQILLYSQGEKITTPERTVQRWMGAYQASEAQSGCGYIGLLAHVADRGNRLQRIPDASLHPLETALKNHYAAPQAKRAAAVYRLYREQCVREQIPPVSERTFYRVLARFSTPEVTSARRGRRAAYNEQPFFWWVDQTTPRHGERPFALTHLDHTELDIELVSSVTGKPLGRPWATFLVDAYSRRPLAVD